MTDPPAETTFSFGWLAGAAGKVAPLTIDDQGNLVVTGRVRYQPLRFAPGLRGVICRLVSEPTDPPRS